MFQGFTDETSRFFWELGFNNERPWFLEHKEQFEQVLNAPFKALAADTMALLEQRFPDRDLRLHVSRIYRDARRLFGRGPYKDHLWFSIKSGDALLEGPMFWFEVGARDYGYGMGFYSASAAQMEAFRRGIDANPARFERLAGAIARMPELSVTGEQYAKPKGSHSPVIDLWYNRRRVGAEHSGDFGAELKSPELPQRLVETYVRLMPMYDFLLEFYREAPPDTRKRP